MYYVAPAAVTAATRETSKSIAARFARKRFLNPTIGFFVPLKKIFQKSARLKSSLELASTETL